MCHQNCATSRMDFHMTQLKQVCRVCGKRLSKAKERDRSYTVAEHSRELAEVFGIEVACDSPDTHPLSFCHICRVFMRSWHTRGRSVPSVGRVFTWFRHSELNCSVSKSSPQQWKFQILF